MYRLAIIFIPILALGLLTPRAADAQSEDLPGFTDLQPEMRRVIAAAFAVLPDDIIAATLKVSEHPEYIKTLKPHPTDTSFNSAAGYLYNTEPELFSLIQGSPLMLRAFHDHIDGDYQRVWRDITRLRKHPPIQQLMVIDGVAPLYSLAHLEVDLGIFGSDPELNPPTGNEPRKPARPSPTPGQLHETPYGSIEFDQIAAIGFGLYGDRPDPPEPDEDDAAYEIRRKRIKRGIELAQSAFVAGDTMLKRLGPDSSPRVKSARQRGGGLLTKKRSKTTP